MLSAEAILSFFDEDEPRRLTVVPEPSRADIKKRSATSLDLRLGRWFRSFKQTHTASFDLSPPPVESGGEATVPSRERSHLKTKQHFIPFGKPFVIHPGSFVLGATLEWLDLPSALSAYVTGKSTLGRHGLIIETAAGIHPGFSGCLTLELGNVGEIPLEIYPGMRICQIFFHEVEVCGEANRGVASGQRKPALPRQTSDAVFDHLSCRVGTV